MKVATPGWLVGASVVVIAVFVVLAYFNGWGT